MGVCVFLGLLFLGWSYRELQGGKTPLSVGSLWFDKPICMFLSMGGSEKH